MNDILVTPIDTAFCIPALQASQLEDISYHATSALRISIF